MALDRRAVKPADRTGRTNQSYPSSRGWLAARVWEATAFREQLEHLLSREECVAFLAAVPQAGRILRPLCHMLGVEVVPEVIRGKLPALRVVPVAVIEPVGILPDAVSQFLAA